MPFTYTTMRKITTGEIHVRLLNRLETAYKRELELLEFEYVISHEVDRETFIESRTRILNDLLAIRNFKKSLSIHVNPLDQ